MKSSFLFSSYFSYHTKSFIYTLLSKVNVSRKNRIQFLPELMFWDGRLIEFGSFVCICIICICICDIASDLNSLSKAHILCFSKMTSVTSCFSFIIVVFVIICDLNKFVFLLFGQNNIFLFLLSFLFNQI